MAEVANIGGKHRWLLVAAGLTGVAILLVIGGVLAFDASLDRVPVDGLSDRDEGAVGSADDDAVLDGEAADDDAVADDADGQDAAEDPDEPSHGVTHVLVVGSDDRSVLDEDERRRFNTGDAWGERTEAIAVARLDPDADTIDVLRFPRDLLVDRCDGSRGRINAAWGIGEREELGGATCLVRTLRAWTGIPIHHVAKIDFRGFLDLVDAVGGVELELAEPLRDSRSGLDLDAGCVELDGPEALAFVRARQLDDDFGRIGRQQQLTAAALDQVLSPSTLANPARMTRLGATAQRSVELDDDLTLNRMLSLARTAGRIGTDGLVSETVPGEADEQNGMWFLQPHEEEAEELFAAFRLGQLADLLAEREAAEAARAERERASQDDEVPSEPREDVDDVDDEDIGSSDRDGPDEAEDEDDVEDVVRVPDEGC